MQLCSSYPEYCVWKHLERCNFNFSIHASFVFKELVSLLWITLPDGALSLEFRISEGLSWLLLYLPPTPKSGGIAFVLRLWNFPGLPEALPAGSVEVGLHLSDVFRYRVTGRRWGFHRNTRTWRHWECWCSSRVHCLPSR